MDAILFYVFAAVAVASALVVIGQKNPLTSAFALIATLCSVAVLFALLGAPFIAALQVIVYAGAIMVLFLFVLMLLNVKPEQELPARGGRTLSGVAAGLVALLVLQAGAVLLGRGKGPVPEGFDGSTRAMARVLFDPHFLYVFEATSILIVVALVGAVVLAKKEL